MKKTGSIKNVDLMKMFKEIKDKNDLCLYNLSDNKQMIDDGLAKFYTRIDSLMSRIDDILFLIKAMFVVLGALGFLAFIVSI